MLPLNEWESKLLKFVKENSVKYYTIGRGSNVIFRDCGFDGVVIKTANMQQIEYKDETTVFAGAGVPMNVLCKSLQEHSLEGLEFCYGIPGNIGGGLYMTIICYFIDKYSQK